MPSFATVARVLVPPALWGCGLGLLATVAPSAWGQVTLTSPSSSWAAHPNYLTFEIDPPGDQLSNRIDTDFVGSPGLPVFQAVATDDAFYLRFRLNQALVIGNEPYQWRQVLAVGIDVTGSGFADIAYAVTGRNGPGVSAGQTYFMAFGESLSATPTTTDWGNAFSAANWRLSGPDANVNHSYVTAIDPFAPAVPGSGSQRSDNENIFLTLRLEYSQLEAALRLLPGYENATVNAGNAPSFRFSGHTGTQTDSVNVDVFNNGQIIPETSTYVFLGCALLPLMVWRFLPEGRRRRLARLVTRG
jgi:hypothetical protein